MRINHIGIVCTSIKDYIKENELVWNDARFSEIIDNPVQKVKECFVYFENDISIELLEPLGEKSPVFKFLASGGGIHHICYEVDNIQQVLKDIKNSGGLVVCKPIPDIAFNGGFIAFVKLKNGLIELLQKNRE